MSISKVRKLTFIDLFAGAGGMSEGFIRAGFVPVAHVEMDRSASDTLMTRQAYHILAETNQLNIYYSYLKGEISRQDLWKVIPESSQRLIINREISNNSIAEIFSTIDELLGKRTVDVVIGGPPCQAYSLVGRSRDPNGMKGDKRNYLFKYYAKFLEKYKPKIFVFENVLGLLSAGSSRYLTEMLSLFKKIGYETEYSVLNSEEFGVVQKRSRVIIIGHWSKKSFDFSIISRNKYDLQTKRDLLYDLPKLLPGDSPEISYYKKPASEYLLQSKIRSENEFVTQHITRRHNQRDLEIYSIAINKWIKEGTRLKYTDLPARLITHKNLSSFLDRFKVVDPFGPSHTMVAHISKDGHHYIYPDSKQIRSISVREAARIQSFPDDYFFEGGRTAAFKQIGNAVPPLMAEKVAASIMHFLIPNQFRTY